MLAVVITLQVRSRKDEMNENAQKKETHPMVASRRRGIGPPSGIVLGTLFWLAADLVAAVGTPSRQSVTD